MQEKTEVLRSSPQRERAWARATLRKALGKDRKST